VEAIRDAFETQPSQTDINPCAPQAHSSKDRSAEFEAITLPNLRALHGKARQLLRDSSAADDIVQETCLRAWQTFDRFTPGTKARVQAPRAMAD
jgi:DNA-directed RNA polymerase specialized sigma24 family protein